MVKSNHGLARHGRAVPQMPTNRLGNSLLAIPRAMRDTANTGLPADPALRLNHCKARIKGGMQREPFGKSGDIARNPDPASLNQLWEGDSAQGHII